MSAAVMDKFKRYNMDDINSIVIDEDLDGESVTFLTAISTFAIVVIVPGEKEGKPAGFKSVDIPVIEVENYSSGIYSEPGQQPIILLNVKESIIDYDFISEIHPTHDSEIYLWLDTPWNAADTPLGVYGEWYRSDVYPDGIKEFNGETLEWEDLPPKNEGENK